MHCFCRRISVRAHLIGEDSAEHNTSGGNYDYRTEHESYTRCRYRCTQPLLQAVKTVIESILACPFGKRVSANIH